MSGMLLLTGIVCTLHLTLSCSNPYFTLMQMWQIIVSSALSALELGTLAVLNLNENTLNCSSISFVEMNISASVRYVTVDVYY